MSIEQLQRFSCLTQKFLAENVDFSVDELKEFNELILQWSLDSSHKNLPT